MRGWVNAVGNYSEPVPLMSVMRSFAVGVIDESNHPDYQVGMNVTGLFGWQDYAVVHVSVIEQILANDDLPISTALGVLGINGVTAHYGLLEVGQPKPGETVIYVPNHTSFIDILMLSGFVPRPFKYLSKVFSINLFK